MVYRQHLYPNREKPMKIDWQYLVSLFLKNLTRSLAWLFSLSILFAIIYPIYKNATMPIKISYCYLEATGSRVILKGFVEWHQDQYIDFFNSSKEAKAFAKELNCPLNIIQIDSLISIEK